MQLRSWQIYKETVQDSKQLQNYKGAALQAPIALQTMSTDTRVVSVGQLPLVQQGLLLHKMAQTLYPHEVFIHRLGIRYRNYAKSIINHSDQPLKLAIYCLYFQSQIMACMKANNCFISSCKFYLNFCLQKLICQPRKLISIQHKRFSVLGSKNQGITADHLLLISEIYQPV